MVGCKFEPGNIIGLKIFKGTTHGPAEYLPEGVKPFRLMNKEEMDRYDRKVTRSKGFDVDGCTGAMPGRIIPISPDTREWEVANRLACWAANEHGGNRLESISVVKANSQPVQGAMYYITFTAFDTADRETKTYRAKVWHEPVKKYHLEYFKEFKPSKKAGTSYKARAGMPRSKTSKAKKGKAVQGSGVLPGFNALLRKIKSQNPSMTHTMARKAASKNWKLLSNAEKKIYISEANLKKQI